MTAVERVTVVVRLRPLTTNDCTRSIRVDTKRQQIYVRDEDKERVFEVDGVLDENATQTETWKAIGSGLGKVLQGYNATIMAYGQTGSGKTYSMGAPSDSAEFALSATGQALSELFFRVDANKDQYSGITISYLEVYNEAVYDLLATESENTYNQQLTILEEKTSGQIIVKHLSEHRVASLDDAIKLLARGSVRRKVGSTKMNKESSRSHAMIWVKVTSTDSTCGKLSLVDLAGSERQAKTGATGDRLQEGIQINKGLLVLGQVVSTLADNAATRARSHIPFRDSKLTRLLADSLGGTATTCLLACIAPESQHRDETTNTLRYATRARDVTNISVRHVVTKKDDEQITYLRAENDRLRRSLESATVRIASLEKQLVISSSQQTEPPSCIVQEVFDDFEEEDPSLDSNLDQEDDEEIDQEISQYADEEYEEDSVAQAARTKYTQAVTTLEAEIAALEKARDEVAAELERKLSMAKTNAVSNSLKKEIEQLRESVRQRKQRLETKSRELEAAIRDRDRLREDMAKVKRERVTLERRLREEAAARAKSTRAAHIAELRVSREQERSKAALSKLKSEHQLQAAVLRRKCQQESSLLRRQRALHTNLNKKSDSRLDPVKRAHHRFVDTNLNARLEANVNADVQKSNDDDDANNRSAIRLPPLSAVDARLALRWYHQQLVLARRAAVSHTTKQAKKNEEDDDSEWEIDEEAADDDDDDDFKPRKKNLHSRKSSSENATLTSSIATNGFGSMTVAQLKSELKSLNLKTVGRKSELIDRLQAHRIASCAMPSQNIQSCANNKDKCFYVLALYDCVAENQGELAFSKGSRIQVTSQAEDPWWSGVLDDGTTGLFPSNYVQPLLPSNVNSHSSTISRQPLRIVNV